MRFLILSKSRSQGIAVWWRPGQSGYTNDVDTAGRYSAEESERIVSGAPEKDMRVPEYVIDRLATRCIVDIGDANNYADLMAYSEV